VTFYAVSLKFLECTLKGDILQCREYGNKGIKMGLKHWENWIHMSRTKTFSLMSRAGLRLV